MSALRQLSAAIAVSLMSLGPLAALQPSELLEDPILEQRARDLSAGLRCLVCQNESIDESNSDFARDLRLLVRERILAGDTDQQVLDFLVERFDEYVLLTPSRDGANVVLWYSGPALLLIALVVGFGFIRTRAQADPSRRLDADEENRIHELHEKGRSKLGRPFR